ncbi:MAG: DUF4129 domain-containing protein [Acidimicrobiales bacterium]
MTRRRRRRLAATALVLALGVTLAGSVPASADSVTSEELRRIAADAQSDPTALERLRRIDVVDGRPMDLAAALDGADGDQLSRRLELLSEAPAPAGGAGSSTDQAAARRILDGRKYNPVEAPRPLRGVLRQLGEWLSPLGRPFRAIADNDGLLVLAALATIAGATVVAARLTKRRTAAVARGPAGVREVSAEDDPARLDQLADEAERRGDLRLAYRLRFRAGVLRLKRAGVVADRPSMTTGALARQVHSPGFDHLAGDFDEVAYGELPVAPSDLAEARQTWRRVLDEAGRP